MRPDIDVELALRVNEAFHDAEGSDYHHPEIFGEEQGRWQRVIQTCVVPIAGPKTVLDIGSGTGFVPLQFSSFLSSQDRLICSDVSAEMLEHCRRTLPPVASAELSFLKLDGRHIQLEDGSVNVITLNSVLHHLPNLAEFFAEADRILMSDGLIMIAHEPNRLFFQHDTLWRIYRVMHYALHPRHLVGNLMRKLGLWPAIARLLGRSSQVNRRGELVVQVNEILCRRGVIEEQLSYHEISRLVDIHSPTAGGFDRSRGFDPLELHNAFLAGYALEHLESYSHLAKVTTSNSLTRAIDGILRRLFPDHGSLFMIVLRKPGLQNGNFK